MSMIDVKAINHIGIAVHSIEAHREFYEHTLGAIFEGIHDVPGQKVRVGFFVIGPPGHEVRLELVEATSEDAAVADFIRQHGESLHHVAYTVDSLDEGLAALAADGIRLRDLTSRPGIHHNRKIAYLDPESSHGVLTELCETSLDPRKRES
jgi:methylmalonyl-CoA/ethylmalonyl-CoA epimerase